MKYKVQETIKIPANGLEVTGDLNIPENAKGLVIFSHGSGSSRLISRNRFVARELEKENLATLLFDLLTEKEDLVFENRFDINLLTQRLIRVTQWLQDYKDTKGLILGYFGASTGAASALRAAAELGEDIKAVISRGGRPDLAIPVLPKVKAAILLMVGSLDHGVIELNQKAFDVLNAKKEMSIIEGATHLFEEPGTLEQVADIAGKWFNTYLK